MKSFLRICLACLCMLALTHAHIKAQAPAISEMYVFNGSGLATPTNIPIHTPVYLRFNKNVFQVGGAAYANGANVAGLFTLSLLPVPMPAVPLPTFTATIDATAGGQFITIIFSEQLRSGTTYTLALAANSVQDATTPTPLPNIAQSVSFETASSVAVTAPTLNICANGDYALLGPIVITEGTSASFGEGNSQIFEINATANFEFESGVGNVTTSGSDISTTANTSIIIAPNKIIVIYDIGTSYFAGTDAITISGIRMRQKAISLPTAFTGELLLRTGGNAVQAGNRTAIPRTLATINSLAVPATPVTTTITRCLGDFNVATTIPITGLGATTTFANIYDSSYGYIQTVGVTAGSATITLSNLVSTTLSGTETFFFTTFNAASCQSLFSSAPNLTITVNPVSVAVLSLASGSASVCTPSQNTYTVNNVVGATYQFYLSLNGGTYALATAAQGTQTGNIFTTSTTLLAGNYQIYAVTTVGCPSPISNVFAFTVNPAPVVGFDWTGNSTSYPNSSLPINLVDSTFPFTFGGTVGGVFNVVGGTYSGIGVAGNLFNPSIIPAALFNTAIPITYTYTLNGCTSSAIINLQVFNGSNSIVNLAPTYCSYAALSMPLSPATGGATAIAPTFVSFGLGTNNVNEFIFPANFNVSSLALGILNFTAGNYIFDASKVPFPNNEPFIDVTLTIFTFSPVFGPSSTIAVPTSVSVRIFNRPILTTNLISNRNFCTTDVPFLITPFVFGATTTSGTTTVEIHTFPGGAFTTLAGNTITPTLLVTGNYEIRYTHTIAIGCTNTLLIPFSIQNNPIPIMSIREATGITAITTACVEDVNIRLNTTVTPPANSFYTITKSAFPPFNIPANTTGLSTLVGITSMGGAGIYTITLTTPNGGCSSTSVVSNLTIYATPISDFTFVAGAPSFSVCDYETTFTLTVPAPLLTSGSGFFRIKKTTGGASGKDFPLNVFTFNPTTFNAVTNPTGDFDTATGTGVGVYEIRYVFTSTTGSCLGISLPKNFTIRERPLLTLTIPSNEICNKVILPPLILRDLITVVPSWTNRGTNTIIPGSGVVKIYDSANNLLDVLGAGINIIDPNSTILNNILVNNPTIVNNFQAEYTYTDATGCVGVSAKVPFKVNPLPIPTISFAGANTFCLASGAIANFTVGATLVGSTFDGSKGFITIKNDVGTPFYNNPLPNGINTFDVSALGASRVGRYIVEYTYTDTKSCSKTVVCPTPLEFYFYSAPDFLFPATLAFPAGSPSYSVCETATNVDLRPFIIATGYGADASITNVRGEYKITKNGGNGFVWTIPGGIANNITDGFNPQILVTDLVNGGIDTYTITYFYTSANNCTGNGFARQLTINPVPIVTFDFAPVPVIAPAVSTNIDILGNGFFCADFTTIGLIPSVSGIGGSFSIQQIGVFPLPAPIIITPPVSSSPVITRTDLNMTIPTTTVKTYQIVFRYTNANGCIGTSVTRTFTIIPVPQPLFTVAPQKCVNIPVLFDATTSIIQPTLVDAVVSYTWDFDDSSPIEVTTSQTISHIFTTPGSFNVSLTITSVLGCTKTVITTVIIGAIPVAGFTTANFCQGTTTTFASTSTLLGSGNITTYDWVFGDTTPAVIVRTTTPNTTYLYTAPGRYTVTLTVTTNSFCTNTFTREVLIFPRITPTAATPYKENFDTNDGFWLANGLIKSTVNPTLDIVGYSWAGGVPTGVKINASTTAGGAWSTKTNANTFYPNERSYVESPCFNFTDPTLNKPIISMKIWYDTDRGSDGAVLYASKDDGLTWNVVGNINDGIEWYNTAGIIAQPGGQPVVNAWTGNTLTNFKIAKFALDQFIGLPSVRFRVAFGSNGDNPVGAGVAFDGFAFDEIFIGNRNRIALLEHFTNAASSEANTENTYINNFPPSTSQNEVYNIQYHTNFPGNDPMNNDNTADPSARALFYGVSQTPRTALDGVIENRKFSEWGVPVYGKRTLETAPFEISVSFPSIPRELLNITATVKALEPFARRVIVQTVVVEQEILGTVFTTGNFGGLTFKNVVKKMIPNAAGSRIDKTWLAGTQDVLNLNWNPIKVYNGNKLVVVVFVQDDITKEIYQAAYFNVTTNPTGINPATALDPQTQANSLDNEFVVYPNPAQNEVFTGFRNEAAEDFNVVIFDSYGKRLDIYSLSKGNKGLLLTTEKYASGMYFVEITGKNNIKARRKLVIAR